MKRGSPPMHQAMVAVGQEPMAFTPRVRLRPVGAAIQRALMRKDPGDTRTRLEKFGEMVVKRAMAGETEWAKIMLDRFEGKVMPMDEDGGDDPAHLQGVLLTSLVEALVERKLSSAKVIDGGVTSVVQELVRKKTSKE